MWFDLGKGVHFHRVVVDDNKMLIFAKSMMMMMMVMTMTMMMTMVRWQLAVAPIDQKGRSRAVADKTLVGLCSL